MKNFRIFPSHEFEVIYDGDHMVHKYRVISKNPGSYLEELITHPDFISVTIRKAVD